MEKSDMHYRGFIDTLAKYGIEKDAAARIYKEAGGAIDAAKAGWGLLKGLFTGGRAAAQGAKGIVQTARQGVQAIERSGAQAAQAAQRLGELRARMNDMIRASHGRSVGTVRSGAKVYGVKPAPTSAGPVSGVRPGAKVYGAKPTAQGARTGAKVYGVKSTAQGVRPEAKVYGVKQPGSGARPEAKVYGVRRQPAGGQTSSTPHQSSTPQQPAAQPQNPAAPQNQQPSNALQTAGGAQESANAAADTAKKFSLNPVKWYTNFVAKHPIIGTGTTMLGTGFFVNKANNAYRENPEYNTVRTMTPSESMAWNRLNSGNYLPGLGLDPYYFNGSI